VVQSLSLSLLLLLLLKGQRGTTWELSRPENGSVLPSNIRYSLSHFLLSSCSNMNSVTLVRKRAIPTGPPLLVGEVGDNFFGYRVSRDRRNGFPRPYSRLSGPKPVLFLPSNLSVTPLQTHYFSENMVSGIERGPLDCNICEIIIILPMPVFQTDFSISTCEV
jgi:hypothetical protein